MKRSHRARAVAALLAISLLAAACSGAKKAGEESASEVEAGDSTESTLASGETTTTVEGQPAPGGVDGAPAGTAGTTPSGAARPSSDGGAPIQTAAPAGFEPTTLFKDGENTTGITKDSITMCAHAALTYAAAFQTSADDLNVFWTALNESGGVHGRKVHVTYENDDYKPETAVAAATKCKSKNIFMLLGGIGFDQIPAVRNWAEQNRMLYLHHTATVNGSEGKKFSYTALPTTEKMGEMFGQLAATKFKGKKVGIIKRGSPNWEPGVDAFKAYAKKHGITIVKEREVVNAQGNYTQELLDMKNAGAEVVWAWENALSATQIVKQSKAQSYSPEFMLFPFNLTSQTLGNDAMNPPLAGIAMFPAYSKGDYSGNFAPYADDMKQFEAQYAKHRPNVDLSGVAGDLLFLNWVAQKAMYVLLDKCGADCTRNKFIDVLRTYKGRPSSSACDLSFGERHVGSDQVYVMETYRAGDKVNWRNTALCVNKL